MRQNDMIDGKRYMRFIENYRTDTGGINIYPEFDDDLEAILDMAFKTYSDWMGFECSWESSWEKSGGR